MNEMTPKISVIVPVYKAEAYLHRCVDSLLAQTFTDFEILLVDDGSPDRSGEICDEYARKDTRVRVWHTPNKGVSAARNLGIEKSDAEWICFVDSDDWVENNYLFSFFQDDASPQTLVFQGILFDYDSPSKRNRPFMKYEDKLCKYPFGNKIIQQRILHDGCPYAKLYNKRIIQINNIRFLEQLSTHEDHVFVWTYLNFVKEIRLCSTLAYHYMRMNNNETLSTKYHSSEEYILASDNLLKQLSILQESLNLKNNQYLKEVYSDYGLSQLLRACKNADSANYIKVYNYVRSKKKIFDVHYISRKYSERIFTAILFYRLLPNKLLYCLVKLFATK